MLLKLWKARLKTTEAGRMRRREREYGVGTEEEADEVPREDVVNAL